MSQKHEYRERKCEVCAHNFVTTAAEIKKHAAECAKEAATVKAAASVGLWLPKKQGAAHVG